MKKVILLVVLVFIVNETQKKIDWNKFNKTVDIVIEKIYNNSKDKKIEKRIKKYLYEMDSLIIEAKK